MSGHQQRNGGGDEIEMVQPSGLFVAAGRQAGQDVVGGPPAFFFDERTEIGTYGVAIHSEFVSLCFGQMLGIEPGDQRLSYAGTWVTG